MYYPKYYKHVIPLQCWDAYDRVAHVFVSISLLFILIKLVLHTCTVSILINKPRKRKVIIHYSHLHKSKLLMFNFRRNSLDMKKLETQQSMDWLYLQVLILLKENKP